MQTNISNKYNQGYTHKSYRLIAAGRVIRVLKNLFQVFKRGVQSIRCEQVLVFFSIILLTDKHNLHHCLFRENFTRIQPSDNEG